MHTNQLLESIKKKAQHVNLERKHAVIAVLIITTVALIIASILLIKVSQEFISADYISEINEIHNNHVRLEIFRLCFVLLLIAAAGAVCVLMILRIKLEYIYLTAALCLGIAYMFSITPLSGPDEPHHYQMTYVLSGQLLFNEDPHNVDARHFSFYGFAGHHNIPHAYLRLIDEGVSILPAETEKINLDALDAFTTYSPLFYLPQALGVSLARLIGLSFFGVFFLGRFFNLLFYVLCVTFSIKRLKSFRLPLFFIGLLPMTLQQAASFNYDSYINGITILLVSYAISCIYERDSFRWSDFAALLVLSILLAPAKLVYLPMVFIVFLAAWRWKETIKAKAWILAGTIVFASFATIFIFMGANVVEAAGEQTVNWEGGYNYTLSFILKNPFETIMMFIRTLGSYYVFYWYSMFGRHLSGLTLELPLWNINITILILFASVLYGKRDEWQPSFKERVVYILVCFAVVVLNFTAMMLGWTSDWHTVILGVQGRYFIPILPLALILLRFRKILVEHVSFYTAVIAVFLLMQGLAIMHILDTTIGKF